MRHRKRGNRSFVASFHGCQRSLERRCHRLESSCFWFFHVFPTSCTWNDALMCLQHLMAVFGRATGYNSKHRTANRHTNRCISTMEFVWPSCKNHLRWATLKPGGIVKPINLYKPQKRSNNNFCDERFVLKNECCFLHFFCLWASKWMYVEEYFPFWNTL